jgi:hypothetical protein
MQRHSQCDAPSNDETATKEKRIEGKQAASRAPSQRGDESNGLHPPKPPRNLSAYNFYFKDQRRKMLEALPIRSEGKPRRSHGKIGFSDLARTIAAGWKSIDHETRIYYENLAMADKERYARELEAWKVHTTAIGQRKLLSRKSEETESEGKSRASRTWSDPPARRRPTVALPPIDFPEFPMSKCESELSEETQSSVVTSQALGPSLRSRSQEAIEHLARPLRVAASEPNLQLFNSYAPQSPADDASVAVYSPTFDIHSFHSNFSTSAIQPPSPLLTHVASGSTPASLEYIFPGGLALPRPFAGSGGALDPNMPLCIPSASIYPTTTPELRQRLVQHLANQLDSEEVDMFLNLFRRDDEN